MSKFNASFKHSLRSLTLAAALGGGLILAGCAGTPPTDQMRTADAAITSAMTAGGSQYAAAELKFAQDKMSQARIEYSNKNYDQARILSQQAEWDARVAERRAQAMKAQQAVRKADRGINDMRRKGIKRTLQ